MKRLKRLGSMLLLAGLLVLPGRAVAEVYVEGYLGGVFAPNAGMTTTTHSGIFDDRLRIQGRIDPAFQGGLKLGTWFVKEGFPGFNYPAWARFFGFYTDFSFQGLNFPRQQYPHVFGPVPPGAPNPNFFYSNGYAATWAFMFAARYGFLPDANVPFGRLQPYVAVGPALFFSGQAPRLRVQHALGGAPYNVKADSDSSVNLGLAVEAGLRWMALKNVSLEASFKYRYVNPTYSFRYFDPFAPFPRSFSISPAYNLLSFQVGAGYHF